MAHAPAIDWYRFLDARDAEEAAGEVRQIVVRLEALRDEVETATAALTDSPDPHVCEAAWMARTTLAELIGQLEMASVRFWESQRECV